MNRRNVFACLASALAGTGALAGEPEQTGDSVVGRIGPFTVLPAPDPKELNEGFKACFRELNARGGINGRKVSLFELDDAYSFEGFRKQLPVALARKPVALLSPVGSATLKGVLDARLLDDANIVIINAVPGAEVLRSPGHPKLFHIRAGDQQQIHKIVEHAKTLTIKSMGVLYQNIPIGTSGFAAAQEAAAELGDIRIAGFKSTSEAGAIAEAAKAMAQANVQSGLVVGPPKFMGDGVAALRRAGVSQQLFTLSYIPGPALLKAAGEGARGVGIAQTFPNPMGSVLPLQREFRSAMKKAFPAMTSYTTFHMEGYVTARVFVEAASRAKRMTPEGIAQALRDMGELDLGGFRVNFSKSNIGSNFVDIGVVLADGKLMY